MNSALKWVLLGVGGYLILKEFGIVPNLLPSLGSPAGNTPGAPSVSPQQPSTTKGLVAAEAQKLGLNPPLSGYQWNWVLQRVRALSDTQMGGIPGTQAMMTLDEWWSQVQPAVAAALPGMGNYVRMRLDARRYN